MGTVGVASLAPAGDLAEVHGCCPDRSMNASASAFGSFRVWVRGMILYASKISLQQIRKQPEHPSVGGLGTVHLDEEILGHPH